MTNTKSVVVAHMRAPQILSLLNEYGPLSVKGLQAIIKPQITKRRLQECLLRLYQKGLVIRRFEASPFSRQYYELSQSDNIRGEINRLTGIPQDRLLQPYFRSQELLHNEECAHWAFYFQEMFPDAIVVRDFKFKEHPDVVHHLMLDKDDTHLMPDLVIYFPKTHDKNSVFIAVEIELTRKSNERLYAKIKKYTNATFTSGLIYLCHKNSLIDVVKATYNKSLDKKSLRIDHYGDYFLLFGDRSFNAETLEPKLLTRHGEDVSLKHWISVFRENPNNYHLKEKFKTPA